MTHEAPQGVRLEEGGGVGEDQDLVARRLHAVVERARLATALGKDDDADARPLGPGQDGVGAVAGPVRDEDDLELVVRVVELDQVRELGGKARLLVVGGHHEADAREGLRAQGRPPPVSAAHQVPAVAADLDEPVDHEEQGRIDEVGVGHHEEAAPEGDLGHGDAHERLPPRSTSRTVAARIFKSSQTDMCLM